MKSITITVDHNGNFTLEAQGFEGSSCLDATEGLEALLGKVENREYNPENNTPRNTTQTHIHQ